MTGLLPIQKWMTVVVMVKHVLTFCEFWILNVSGWFGIWTQTPCWFQMIRYWWLMTFSTVLLYLWLWLMMSWCLSISPCLKYIFLIWRAWNSYEAYTYLAYFFLSWICAEYGWFGQDPTHAVLTATFHKMLNERKN